MTPTRIATGRVGRCSILTCGLWIALVLTLAVGRRPAEAQADNCFTGLWICFQAVAAAPAGWFDTWLSGLDCELTAVDCERQAALIR